MTKKYIMQLAVYLLLLHSLAKSQVNPASITIGGDIPSSIVYTLNDLNMLQRTVVSVNDMALKKHDFSGFAVSDILQMAGVLKPEFRRDNLLRYVIMQAPDNYEVLFSMTELDSSYSGNTIILADKMDGMPLPPGKGPFRIVVPSEEKKEARWIWSVSSMIIKNSKD